MCIILDTNIHNKIVNKSGEADRLVRNWIENQHGSVVFSEFEKISVEMKSLLDNYSAAGKAHKTPVSAVLQEATKLKKQCELLSDDENTLALARITGARLLYTEDTDLQEDFTNPKIIGKGKRRGKVFSLGAKKLLRRKDLCARKK